MAKVNQNKTEETTAWKLIILHQQQKLKFHFQPKIYLEKYI